MLVEMYPTLVSWILANYKWDPWWARLELQIQASNNLGVDAAALPIVVGSMAPTDSDPHLVLRLDGDENYPLSSMNVEKIPEESPIPAPPSSISVGEISQRSPVPDKSKFFYHINTLINVHHLCILPLVALNILTIAHKKSHLGFSRSIR